MDEPFMTNHEYEAAKDTEPIILRRGETYVLGAQPSEVSPWASLEQQADDEGGVKVLAELRLGSLEDARSVQIVDLRDAPITQQIVTGPDGRSYARNAIEWNGFTFEPNEAMPYAVVDVARTPIAVCGVWRGEATVLGRGNEENQKRFQFGPKVSREHVFLEVRSDGTLYVIDNSSNGTQVVPQTEKRTYDTTEPIGAWDDLAGSLDGAPSPVVQKVSGLPDLSEVPSGEPRVDANAEPPSLEPDVVEPKPLSVENEPDSPEEDALNAEQQGMLDNALQTLRDALKESRLEDSLREQDEGFRFVVGRAQELQDRTRRIGTMLREGLVRPDILDQLRQDTEHAVIQWSQLVAGRGNSMRISSDLIDVADNRYRAFVGEGAQVETALQRLKDRVTAEVDALSQASQRELGQSDMLINQLHRLLSAIEEIAADRHGYQTNAERLQTAAAMMEKTLNVIKRSHSSVHDSLVSLQRTLEG